MSLYKVETRAGSVSITKNVIGKIVIESVKKFKGKVMISNHRGKATDMAPKKEGAGAINTMDINMGAKGLDLRIYVVINFGTSIGAVTDRLIEDIHTRTKELTGIEPNSIAIIVTGLISKDQMTRRNIEVKRQ